MAALRERPPIGGMMDKSKNSKPHPEGFEMPEQSSDSELLTPSEIASLRKDMQERAQLADELFSDEKRG